MRGLTEIKHPANGPKYSCVKAWRTQANEVFKRFLVNWTSAELGRVRIQIRRMGSAKGRRIKETTRSYQSATKAVFSLICQQPSCCLSAGSRQRRILRIDLMKWVKMLAEQGIQAHSKLAERIKEIYSYRISSITKCELFHPSLPEQWSPPFADAKKFSARPLSQSELEIIQSSPYIPGEGGIHDGGHFKAADVGNFLSPRWSVSGAMPIHVVFYHIKSNVLRHHPGSWEFPSDC